jgi:hypothetical protein
MAAQAGVRVLPGSASHSLIDEALVEILWLPREDPDLHGATS